MSKTLSRHFDHSCCAHMIWYDKELNWISTCCSSGGRLSLWKSVRAVLLSVNFALMRLARARTANRTETENSHCGEAWLEWTTRQKIPLLWNKLLHCCFCGFAGWNQNLPIFCHFKTKNSQFGGSRVTNHRKTVIEHSTTADLSNGIFSDYVKKTF